MGDTNWVPSSRGSQHNLCLGEGARNIEVKAVGGKGKFAYIVLVTLKRPPLQFCIKRTNFPPKIDRFGNYLSLVNSGAF